MTRSAADVAARTEGCESVVRASCSANHAWATQAWIGVGSHRLLAPVRIPFKVNSEAADPLQLRHHHLERRARYRIHAPRQ